MIDPKEVEKFLRKFVSRGIVILNEEECFFELVKLSDEDFELIYDSEFIMGNPVTANILLYLHRERPGRRVYYNSIEKVVEIAVNLAVYFPDPEKYYWGINKTDIESMTGVEEREFKDIVTKALIAAKQGK